MPVPDYQAVMRPWLELASDGEDHVLQGVIVALADRFKLTPDERAEMLPSGFQAKFTNRVAWAATHLTRAGALTRVARGRYRITDRGRGLLASDQPITIAQLSAYPEYQDFKSRGKVIGAAAVTVLDDVTPAEAIDAAILSVRSVVSTELLDRIKAAPPDFL